MKFFNPPSKEAPSEKVILTPSLGGDVKILPSENAQLLDLEKRLSIVEIKLYELRTLLLEQDYKKQNQLSKFGKRVKRFSV